MNKMKQVKTIESDIDFVVLWVDCNDNEWQKERKIYSNIYNKECDNSIVRYQDWDNFKYWFRCIEKNAPWVRKIHLVTNGQVPKWINTSCTKLNIVKHSDYMPIDALPTFNSNAIEIGIHKINGLASKFVYFNDDMFVTSPVNEKYFFKKNIPVDMEGFIRTPIKEKENMFSALLTNNAEIITKNFSKKEVVYKKIKNWFRPWYGKTFIRSLRYAFNKTFPGFVIPHLSVAYLKKDFEKVWLKEEEELIKTQHNKFRCSTDITHFLIRNWRMCEGNFIPKKSIGKYFSIDTEKSAREVAFAIKTNKFPEICLNEQCSGKKFESIKEIVNTAFEEKYPEKSIFEK